MAQAVKKPVQAHVGNVSSGPVAKDLKQHRTASRVAADPDVSTALVAKFSRRLLIGEQDPSSRSSKDEQEYVLSDIEDVTADLPSKEVKGIPTLTQMADRKLSLMQNVLGVKMLGVMKSGRYSTQVCAAVFVAVNSANGKYGLTLTPGTSDFYRVNYFSNAPSWSGLSGLFDEVYVQKVVMRFIPVNKHSAIAASAGTLTNWNTGAAVIASLQHSATAFSDTSSLFNNLAEVVGHKIFNTGDNMIYQWVNAEKLNWNGPLGDQTTATSTQGWVNVTNTSKIGGMIQASLLSISAAAGTVNSPQTAANIGLGVYHTHLHFRLRV